LRHPLALPAFCLTLLAGSLSLHAQPAALSARDAWIRAIPGSDVAAAYLTVHNGGTQPILIVGVRSPRAHEAMIHETSLVNGESRMRPHEHVALAAGGTLRLAPGGLHIMLHGLTHTPAVGEDLVLVLELAGGSTLTVSARVRPLTDG